jgi:translation elongation factor EF-1alpha
MSKQIHDARVGLAIKGVDADDISRGDVLCSHSSSNLRVTTDTIRTEFIEFLSQGRCYREPNLLIIRWNANQAGKDKTY